MNMRIKIYTRKKNRNTHTHVAREQTSKKKVVKVSKISLLRVFLLKMCESYNHTTNMLNVFGGNKQVLVVC